MLDGFLGEFQFAERAGDEFLHLLAPAEDGDGLLVLVRVDLDLVDQLLVYQLVFVDQHQQPVQLPVQLLVVVQPQEVLLPQLLLLSHDDVQLVLLGPDVGLHCADLRLQLLASAHLVVEVGGVGSGLALVLLRLRQDVVIGDLGLVDLVVEASQLVLRPLGLLVLDLQLGDQLLVVVFGLMEGLV